ncbi:hypothetical protein HYX01_00610 [Candidatus Woesearchaeota archaeon]|nr:hypothetical protein [Candidatus Woesearchaeota archaeon]
MGYDAGDESNTPWRYVDEFPYKVIVPLSPSATATVSCEIEIYRTETPKPEFGWSHARRPDPCITHLGLSGKINPNSVAYMLAVAAKSRIDFPVTPEQIQAKNPDLVQRITRELNQQHTLK